MLFRSRQMADEEGLAIDFYQPSNTQDLADRIISVLQSPEQQEEMATQNFSAALRMTMPQIIHEYIRHFGVERHTKALKSMTRLRRLPRWMPLGLFAGRLRGQNHFRWSDRSTFAYMPGARKSSALLDGDGRRSGSLDTSRHRVDGNSVSLSGDGNGTQGVGLPTSPARTEQDGDPHHHAGQSNAPEALQLNLEQRKPGDAQEKPAAVKRVGPLPVFRPAKPTPNPASRYRKDGTSGT